MRLQARLALESNIRLGPDVVVFDRNLGVTDTTDQHCRSAKPSKPERRRDFPRRAEVLFRFKNATGPSDELGMLCGDAEIQRDESIRKLRDHDRITSSHRIFQPELGLDRICHVDIQHPAGRTGYEW